MYTGIFDDGAIMNLVCVLIVNYKLAIHTVYWTWITALGLFFSIASWFWFSFAFSHAQENTQDEFVSAPYSVSKKKKLNPGQKKK